MTMNTNVPNVSGIQPPSRILNKLAVKNAKSTARNKPLSAACIVLGGQAADRLGARLASMVGLALFGVASCIIAAA
jgi:hypothetical protein